MRIPSTTYGQDSSEYRPRTPLGRYVEWNFELLAQRFDQAFKLISSWFERVVGSPDQRLAVMGTVRRVGSDLKKTMFANCRLEVIGRYHCYFCSVILGRAWSIQPN